MENKEFLNNKKWLQQQYWVRNKSSCEIADELSVSYATVLKYLRLNGIKIKTRSQAKTGRSNGHEGLILLSQEVVEKRAAKIGVELLEAYKGDAHKIKVRCAVCGHQWLADHACIRRGSGCPECGKKKMGRNHRLSKKEAKVRYEEKGVTLVSRYRKLTEPVVVKCVTCGDSWTAKYPDIVCKQCAVTKREEEVLSQLKSKSFEPLEDLEFGGALGSLTCKPLCRCKKCGHQWRTDGTYGCPNCRRLKDTVPIQVIEQRLAAGKLRARQSLTVEVRRKNEYLDVACQECEYEFKIQGVSEKAIAKGCPKCKKSYRGSESELKVMRIAEDLTGWKFKKVRPPWLKGYGIRAMELDGYNEENQVAIEYQGIQHYKPIYGEHRFKITKRNDERKRLICYRKDVLLIRVPYWKKDVEGFIATKLEKAGFEDTPTR